MIHYEYEFAAVVVAGEDETTLCILHGNCQQMVQNITGNDSARGNACLWEAAAMSGPLGSVDNSEIWGGRAECDTTRVDDLKRLFQAPDHLNVSPSATHYAQILQDNNNTDCGSCVFSSLLVNVICCGVVCYSWIQDTLSRGGRLQTKPNHCHPGRSDGNMLLCVYRAVGAHLQTPSCLTHTYPQCHWVFPFSVWQTSTSAKSCRAYAREDSASTPSGASSVNVREATPSTQTPESVKVSDTRMYYL